nr:hypothetical protein [Melaminivora alkalimesophila]
MGVWITPGQQTHHVDAQRQQVQVERTREADHAELRCPVGRIAEIAHQPGQRGHQHQVPAGPQVPARTQCEGAKRKVVRQQAAPVRAGLDQRDLAIRDLAQARSHRGRRR